MRERQERISDLIGEFRKGQRNQAVEKLMYAELSRLTDDQFGTVEKWLYENTDSSKFSLRLADIKSAIRACCPDTEALQVPVKTTCPLCGIEYLYKMGASEDDGLLKNIYTWCPRCGFNGAHIAEQDYYKKSFVYKTDVTLWESLLERAHADWEKRTNPYHQAGYAPFFDKLYIREHRRQYAEKEEQERTAESARIEQRVRSIQERIRQKTRV
jgi:predicted RNA-binding Zn-ribbon protein involved in translation (DUF1610 family)